MIVRTLQDLVGTDRDVGAPTFQSRRFILADEDRGYSFHDTLLFAGSETRMWYKNHIETVYCIEGRGTLQDLETGTVYGIEPGTLYILDKHDRHVLKAQTDLRMICVFTPPLTGDEVHDDEGAYPLLRPDTAGHAQS